MIKSKAEDVLRRVGDWYPKYLPKMLEGGLDAIFMVVYGVAVISSVDNFLKPILMSRAGNLSMLLVVLGVFGGAIAFGFIGLFVGPALLAVGWSVIKTWLGDASDEKPA